MTDPDRLTLRPPFASPLDPARFPADACRGCGRSNLGDCLLPAAPGISWAVPGLCSDCVIAVVRLVFTGSELTFLLHAAGGGDLNLTRPDASALTAEGVLTLRARLACFAPKSPSDAPAIG